MYTRGEQPSVAEAVADEDRLERQSFVVAVLHGVEGRATRTLLAV
jgi:hypothetical protein